MRTILITGTSKGLGHELARCYLEQRCLVIGVSRGSSPFSENKLSENNYCHFIADITDKHYVTALERYLQTLPIGTIDIIINNAGAGSFGEHLSQVKPEEVLKQFDIHCIGALRTLKATQTFLKQSKIVNITSRLGSIAQNQRGDFTGKDASYSYRIAKSAQNMLSLCLANDPELKDNKIISINPGLLLTDSAASDAVHTANEGAYAVISTIDNARSNDIYHAFGDEALY